MNSVQKVYMALEEIGDMEDDELQEALPVPVPIPLARSILPMVARSIPEDAAELDEFLTQVGDFCHGLRSDAPAPA